MVQKYQNEISPIIYYGISTKTNEKDLKITNLQLPDWKHPYWMSLYITGSQSKNVKVILPQSLPLQLAAFVGDDGLIVVVVELQNGASEVMSTIDTAWLSRGVARAEVLVHSLDSGS